MDEDLEESMSDAVFASEGYASVLQCLLDGADFFCHLYVNDPAVSDALRAQELVEPDYIGYAPQSLARWTPPALRSGVAFSAHDIVEWRWIAGPAPQPIRGYYVTYERAGPVLWARRRPDDAFPLGPDSPLLLHYLSITFPPG